MAHVLFEGGILASGRLAKKHNPQRQAFEDCGCLAKRSFILAVDTYELNRAIEILISAHRLSPPLRGRPYGHNR